MVSLRPVSLLPWLHLLQPPRQNDFLPSHIPRLCHPTSDVSKNVYLISLYHVTNITTAFETSSGKPNRCTGMLPTMARPGSVALKASMSVLLFQLLSPRSVSVRSWCYECHTLIWVPVSSQSPQSWQARPFNNIRAVDTRV